MALCTAHEPQIVVVLVALTFLQRIFVVNDILVMAEVRANLQSHAAALPFKSCTAL
jgi:hypothetical protein